MTRELWGIFTSGALIGASVFCLAWVITVTVMDRSRKYAEWRERLPPSPKPEPRILYLCDHRACERCGRYPECNHTSNIEHAKNFERRFGGYRETETSAVRPPRPVEPKG